MNWTDYTQGIESVVTTVAVLVAGVWALFFRREHYPRAKLSHKLYRIPIDNNQYVLRVELWVENVGVKLLQLASITNRLQQVFPPANIGNGRVFQPSPTPSEPEIPWPSLGNYFHEFKREEREIEPSEVESFQFDYVVAGDLRVVQVYSYVTNPAKRWYHSKKKIDEAKELGWSLTEIHEIDALSIKVGKIEGH